MRTDRFGMRRRLVGAGMVVLVVLGVGALRWGGPGAGAASRPAVAVAGPTGGSPASALLCARRGQIPPVLWMLLVQLLHIQCPPTPTTTTGPTTTGPTTTRPTTASTPPTVADCGSYNAASGWPTTTVHQPNRCMLDAFAAGSPARLVVYTSSTGIRLLKTTYEVVGPRRVRVTRDPTRAGGDRITVSECTGFRDGGVAPVVDGCTEISSTPVTAVATETSVVVTPSTATVPANQTVTLAATVVTAEGDPVTVGFVTLTDNLALYGGQTLDANGRATVALARGPGIYYFNLVYSGVDDRYRSSVSAPIRIEVI